MGLSDAMRTGVNGMQACGLKISAVASNLANTSTVGFKRQFADFVTSSPAAGLPEDGLTASVRPVFRANISEQGVLMQTGRATDLAVSGDGFFVVGKSPNRMDSANFGLTRSGSFRIDDDGYLKNSAGLFLFGKPVSDDRSRSVDAINSFALLEPVKIAAYQVDAQQTSSISLAGNLPSNETGNGSSRAPFVSSSRYYTPLGKEEKLEFEWTPTAQPSVWKLAIKDSVTGIVGTLDATFHDSGPSAGTPLSWSNPTNLSTPPSSFSLDAAEGVVELKLGNASAAQVISVKLGRPGSETGVTQFSGDYTLTVNADGNAAAALSSVEVDRNGVVLGLFETGLRKELYRIPLATVTNPDGLLEDDGNLLRLSSRSGPMLLHDPGSAGTGEVISGALERSTVDVTKEVTDLIEVQRTFSSTTKIITTVDEMLGTLTEIKR